MDNEKQNQNNRKSEPEQNSSQENIPLWLQGLDNTEEEDKGEVTNEQQAEGTWTKELNDGPDDEEQNDQKSEKDLPDWLSTLSDVEPEMPEINEDQEADEPNAMSEIDKPENETFDSDETTEKVEIKTSQPEDVSDPKDDPEEEHFSDEGFVEISEMDLKSEPQPDQLGLDDSLSEAEELPYWLKDMIVEQPGESYPHKAMTYSEIVALSKEDTKPINVSGEQDVSEEVIPEEQLSEVEQSVDSVKAAELHETKLEEEPEAIEEPMQAAPETDEGVTDSIEDDTKPVRPHPETSEIEDDSAAETSHEVSLEEEEEEEEEEAAIADQPSDSIQTQEEPDELIEIDTDQWAEKDAPEQAIAGEPESPTPWPAQETAEETEEPSQWLELDTEEKVESPAPSEWPEGEPVLKETELQAPDQWLEEESIEPENTLASSSDLLDEDHVKETEPAIEVERESPDALEDRIPTEETEKVKVKETDQESEDRVESEQEPEQIQMQEEIEQSAVIDQAPPETMVEQEQDFPITQTPEALPEDIQFSQEEAEQPGGTPKTLRFAKYLLDQGDFDRAKEIFKPYIENNQFLEDIEAWLVEASNNGAKKHSGTWELIGDIAMVQNQPSRAFEAYKQAITVLLSTKKETNETD